MLPATSTRGPLLFFAVVALELFTFPMFAGWSAANALAFGAFTTAFLFLPGCAFAAWTDRARDCSASLFMSFVCGLFCLALALVALAVIDARAFIWILPLASAVAWFAARRMRGTAPQPPLSTFEAIAALVPITAALTRVVVETPGEWYLGFETDASFHVENAIELSHRWPMSDPRIAGESLRYHFLSYAPSSAASVVLGLPVRTCMLGLGAHLLPMMFALGVFVAARALKAGAVAAALISLALVMHADLGTFLGGLIGHDASFGSYFDVGLYRSPTTVQGLCVLVAMLIVIGDLFEAQGSRKRLLFLLAALAVLASGSKGSVLPPLVAALALTWLVRGALRPVIARALAVVVVAALPFTLWLSFDPEGYAQNMTSWHPLAAQTLSQFQWKVIKFFGGDPQSPSLWATVLIFLPWLIGFLGIGCVALWAWLVTRVRPASAIEVVLGATFVAGMVPALAFAAPGVSQLFFAYDSQVCAVLLGAVAVTRMSPRLLRFLVPATLAVLVLQLAALCVKPGGPGLRAEFKGDIGRYRAVLDWIRTETPPDAVFLIQQPIACASTWSERRAFYETSRYSARFHAGYEVVGGVEKHADPRQYAEHERLQSSFFAAPTPDDVSALRALVGRGVPLYALRSNMLISVLTHGYGCELRALTDTATFGREAGVELVHDAGVAAVYRLPD
jgi:hypothetical protein